MQRLYITAQLVSGLSQFPLIQACRYRSIDLLMPALMPRPGSRWLAGGRGGGMRCWSVSQTLLAGVQISHTHQSTIRMM